MAITQAVQDVPLWYHTLELPGGTVTPGWFDLRGQVDRLPWPDVRGKRCLDVATYDGFYAFELERRGAAEVIATDISDHESWDWPAPIRAQAGEQLAKLAGEKGRGFEVAHQLLSSNVEKRELNVYDLSPEELGMFDVVICGSLLLHLRDPVRALEAIRSVCHGWFLSIEAVSLTLTALLPRRPAAELSSDDNRCQWWTANAAGHRRMVEVAGFEVVEARRPVCEPFGAGHPARAAGYRRDPRALATSACQRLLTGGEGVPHAAVLARPRLGPPRGSDGV